MKMLKAPRTPDPLYLLRHEEVTGGPPALTLTFVPESWPVEDFRDYLRALMTSAGITDYAELHRLTGVSQTQLSNWRRGLAQPSKESLRKIAPVVKVPPVKLYLMAGLDTQEDLDLSGEVDVSVLPQAYVDLLDLDRDPRLSDDRRAFLRLSVANLVRGLKAELPKDDRPGGRRRSA